jgi:hypothetical protein
VLFLVVWISAGIKDGLASNEIKADILTQSKSKQKLSSMVEDDRNAVGIATGTVDFFKVIEAKNKLAINSQEGKEVESDSKIDNDVDYAINFMDYSEVTNSLFLSAIYTGTIIFENCHSLNGGGALFICGKKKTKEGTEDSIAAYSIILEGSNML